MSKKALVATLAATFCAGGLISLFLTAHFLLPGASKYMFNDPQYIQLSGDKEPISYRAVTDKRYLGNLYFGHQLLFYKRQEGKRILEDLANRGYTPAARDIFHGIMNKLHFRARYKIPVDLTLAQKLEAYKWAMVTAQQGDPTVLFLLFNVYNMSDFIETSQHIAMLEDLAKQSHLPIYADYLAEHYANKKAPQKAAYWAEIAESIIENPPAEPACATITPWRGY